MSKNQKEKQDRKQRRALKHLYHDLRECEKQAKDNNKKTHWRMLAAKHRCITYAIQEIEALEAVVETILEGGK